MLECLAHAAGGDAVTTRWLALKWGVDADLRDPCHPARSAALDAESPAQKLVDAQAALHTACCRYRATTSGDGMALARKLIERRYGSVVADYALAPLDAHSADEWEIDTLLFDTERKPPMPTSEQRTAAARAVADYMLSDPDMADLTDRLSALRTACEAEGRDPRGQRVAATLSAVSATIQAALWRVDEAQRMPMAELVQTTLDTWANATGGPRITVTIEQLPAS